MGGHRTLGTADLRLAGDDPSACRTSPRLGLIALTPPSPEPTSGLRAGSRAPFDGSPSPWKGRPPFWSITKTLPGVAEAPSARSKLSARSALRQLTPTSVGGGAANPRIVAPPGFGWNPGRQPSGLPSASTLDVLPRGGAFFDRGGSAGQHVGPRMGWSRVQKKV